MQAERVSEPTVGRPREREELGNPKLLRHGGSVTASPLPALHMIRHTLPSD